MDSKVLLRHKILRDDLISGWFQSLWSTDRFSVSVVRSLLQKVLSQKGIEDGKYGGNFDALNDSHAQFLLTAGRLELCYAFILTLVDTNSYSELKKSASGKFLD